MNSDTDYSWLIEAEKIAVDTPRVAGAKVGAIIVMKDQLISSGFNSMRSHPLTLKYGKNRNAIALHAELMAIIRATRVIGVENLRYCSLYICRVKNRSAQNPADFVYGMSKPCSGCARASIAFDIKRIIYSLDIDRQFEVIE